ncbi:MAG: nuclear transport factor 2 family protein [Actinomycetota bacterium]
MDRFSAWVERYLAAWRSSDPDDIGSLFSEDALYFTLPTREPWQGRETIVREWLGRKDESGDWWTFDYKVIARDGDLGIVRGVTEYATDEGKAVENLWEVTLDDEDRATRFVEWWIQR